MSRKNLKTKNSVMVQVDSYTLESKRTNYNEI